MIEKNHKKEKVLEILLHQFLLLWKFPFLKYLNTLCSEYHWMCERKKEAIRKMIGLLQIDLALLLTWMKSASHLIWVVRRGRLIEHGQTDRDAFFLFFSTAIHCFVAIESKQTTSHYFTGYFMSSQKTFLRYTYLNLILICNPCLLWLCYVNIKYTMHMAYYDDFCQLWQIIAAIKTFQKVLT